MIQNVSCVTGKNCSNLSTLSSPSEFNDKFSIVKELFLEYTHSENIFIKKKINIHKNYIKISKTLLLLPSDTCSMGSSSGTASASNIFFPFSQGKTKKKMIIMIFFNFFVQKFTFLFRSMMRSLSFSLFLYSTYASSDRGYLPMLMRIFSSELALLIQFLASPSVYKVLFLKIMLPIASKPMVLRKK